MQLWRRDLVPMIERELEQFRSPEPGTQRFSKTSAGACRSPSAEALCTLPFPIPLMRPSRPFPFLVQAPSVCRTARTCRSSRPTSSPTRRSWSCSHTTTATAPSAASAPPALSWVSAPPWRPTTMPTSSRSTEKRSAAHGTNSLSATPRPFCFSRSLSVSHRPSPSPRPFLIGFVSAVLLVPAQLEPGPDAGHVAVATSVRLPPAPH